MYFYAFFSVYFAEQNQNKMKNTKKQKEQVKILGQLVTVGTKQHAKMIYQIKLFNQNGVY